MKYRNDFVTNSSSSVSLWKDFSVTIVPKIEYDKKIVIYGGWPNDLEKTEVEYGRSAQGIPLAGFCFCTETLEDSLLWERFTISDVFIEYLNEVSDGFKIEVKQSKESERLYLITTHKDHKGNEIVCDYDMEPEDAKEWANIYRNKGKTYFLERMGFGYYRLSDAFAHFLLELIEKQNTFSPPFPLWLAEKHGLKGILTAKAVGDCMKSGFLDDMYSQYNWGGHQTKTLEKITDNCETSGEKGNKKPSKKRGKR